MNTETTPAPKEVPQPASGDGVDIDRERDAEGDLLIDWSPRQGRMISLALSKSGELSYAFLWDGESAHGKVEVAASGAPQEAPGDAPSGWQPIETAPKDGTRILVFNAVTGIYSSEWTVEREHLGPDDMRPDSERPIKWSGYPLGVWGGRLGKWYCVPSHWKPLDACPPLTQLSD